MPDPAKPTLEQMIGFAQRSSDDAWLNANTHTAEMFAAIADALRAALGGARREFIEIVREVAAIKYCDEDEAACEADSGPYCQTHGDAYLYEGLIRKARAALAHGEAAPHTEPEKE